MIIEVDFMIRCIIGSFLSFLEDVCHILQLEMIKIQEDRDYFNGQMQTMVMFLIISLNPKAVNNFLYFSNLSQAPGIAFHLFEVRGFF